MDKYRKYYGIMIFAVTAIVVTMVAYRIISPQISNLSELNNKITTQENLLKKKQNDLKIVKNKIKKIQDSILSSQKKIYSPLESDLGQDSLFFTLYNDLIEMVHANSVKIKSLSYVYNPADDSFVEFGKDVYFVCDINLELVSNYVNLGKLIQDIYQYPYHIKINNLTVKPYSKDKTVLLSALSLRLYAHTMPADKD